MFPSGAQKKRAGVRKGNGTSREKHSTGLTLPDFHTLYSSLQSRSPQDSSTSALSGMDAYPSSSSSTMNHHQSLDSPFSHHQDLACASSQPFDYSSGPQSSPFPTSPQPLTSPYPASPSLAFPDAYPAHSLHSGAENISGSSNLGCRGQGYQTPLPVNTPTSSFDVTPFPTRDPNHPTEDDVGIWGGGEARESGQNFQRPWVPESSFQGNATVPSTIDSSVDLIQPGPSTTNPDTQRCQKRKLKMYQWPPQQDPTLEEMRLRALDRFTKRQEAEQYERNLNITLNKSLQEKEAYKNQIAETRESIEWYSQQVSQMQMAFQGQLPHGTRPQSDFKSGSSSMH